MTRAHVKLGRTLSASPLRVNALAAEPREIAERRLDIDSLRRDWRWHRGRIRVNPNGVNRNVAGGQ